MSQFTSEQARFIYFYSTFTVFDTVTITKIFNEYFGTKIGKKNMRFAINAIFSRGDFGPETIGLCEEPWAYPEYFGYRGEDVSLNQ